MLRKLFTLALVGCSAGDEPLELLDNTAWAAVPSSDSLAGQDCSSAAWSEEGAGIEVSTDGCAPVALRQTLVEPVAAGDALEIVWSHLWLFADEPVDGRFLLYLDGALLYEKVEAIPGDPAAYTETFAAPVQGQELTLRIENHGANTWNLLRLTRL